MKDNKIWMVVVDFGDCTSVYGKYNKKEALLKYDEAKKYKSAVEVNLVKVVK